ncbi:hypothetical protein CSV74_06015 [Sporosarcina sp. P19]|uniref:hypothetical protein n=1 Tax=Sporosarcina sp. P19 TaxID=2048258 RepID=UPI000C168E9F|nr:hypothetical protein [Sporosarcina sp. P19]PIC77635.1 hypothetical protein CSV74_06015 [Sporosarcina sp. P19]
MKKVFEAIYEGHRIQVENRWFTGEKLYVDGELQDENLGLAFRGTLNGRIRNKENESKSIKVTLGGFFSIHCKVFVDHVLVPSYQLKTSD